MLSDRAQRTVCSALYRYVANGSKFDEWDQRCYAAFGKSWGTKVLSQPGENHEPDIQKALIRCECSSEDYAGVLAGHNYGHRSERVGLWDRKKDDVRLASYIGLSGPSAEQEDEL